MHFNHHYTGKAANPLNSFLVTLYGPRGLFRKGRASQHIIFPLKIAFFSQTWTTSWAPFSLCFTIVYLLPALGSLKTLQWGDKQKWLSAQRPSIFPASANKKAIIFKMAYLYLDCACRWRGVYISKQFSGTYSSMPPPCSLHDLGVRLCLFAFRHEIESGEFTDTRNRMLQPLRPMSRVPSKCKCATFGIATWNPSLPDEDVKKFNWCLHDVMVRVLDLDLRGPSSNAFLALKMTGWPWVGHWISA